MTTPNETIRIVVADDHPIVRDGLVAVLAMEPEFDMVGTACDGAELMTVARIHQPTVVLTDLEMPELDGVQAIKQLRALCPHTNIIVFTAFDDDDRIWGAVRAGAKGYLLKGAPRDEVFRAVRVVSAGGSLIEPSVAARLLDRVNDDAPSPNDTLAEPLTVREMDVLELLGQGHTNREIAERLVITERTVKFYVSAILGKLGASNRTQAVSIASQLGLISLSM